MALVAWRVHGPAMPRQLEQVDGHAAKRLSLLQRLLMLLRMRMLPTIPGHGPEFVAPRCLDPNPMPLLDAIVDAAINDVFDDDDVDVVVAGL